MVVNGGSLALLSGAVVSGPVGFMSGMVGRFMQSFGLAMATGSRVGP